MFPTLGHVINYIFGTHIIFPMPTYGFILVMAFLTGGLTIRQAFIYREKRGELSSWKEKKLVKGPVNYIDLLFEVLFYGIIFYKIGGIITQYDEFTRSVDNYIFSLRGNLLIGLIGSVLVFYMVWRRAKSRESDVKVYEEVEMWPHHLWLNIMVVAAFSGIFGAKLFDVLEHLSEFFADPIGVFLSPGGFAFYGGLIMGIFGVLVYVKKKNIPILRVMDAAAPAVLAAYAVGRMACMLSGDGCWGIPNPEPKPELLAFLPDWMWAYNFPHNVIKEGVPIPSCNGEYCYMLDTPVFPTPFYESFLSAIFALTIWFIQPKIKTVGGLFFIMLIMNGVARFFIEKIRVNITYNFGDLAVTQAEIIAVFLVISGIIGYFVLKKFGNSTPD